ncbi:hypothetical protein AMTRI_Chr02g217980 [Amborella trichopoda]
MQDKYGDDFDTEQPFNVSDPASKAHLALVGLMLKTWSRQRRLFGLNGKQITKTHVRRYNDMDLCFGDSTTDGNNNRTGYDSPPKENTIQVEDNALNEEACLIASWVILPTQ